MFHEWSDPYDIDNFYENVGEIYKDSNDYINKRSEITIKQPTAIDSAPSKVNVIENPLVNKSNFEVKPNSIFIDGHPVWGQPEYNILRSGPPEYDNKKLVENYINNQPLVHRNQCILNDQNQSKFWENIIIILVFIIGILLIQVVKLNSVVKTHELIFTMFYNDIKNKIS